MVVGRTKRYFLLCSFGMATFTFIMSWNLIRLRYYPLDISRDEQHVLVSSKLISIRAGRNLSGFAPWRNSSENIKATGQLINKSEHKEVEVKGQRGKQDKPPSTLITDVSEMLHDKLQEQSQYNEYKNNSRTKLIHANTELFLVSDNGSVTFVNRNRNSSAINSSKTLALHDVMKERLYMEARGQLQSIGRDLPGKEVFDIHNMGFHESVKASNDNKHKRSISCLGCFDPTVEYSQNVERLCGEERFLVIVVIESAVMNVENREAIRKTWGSACSNGKYYKTNNPSTSTDVKCVFLVGEKGDFDNNIITNEQAEYGDIIQVKFPDTYMNLTYKTITGLNWVSTFCRNAKYMLKTDDDMFVNTLTLPKILNSAPNYLYGGHCWGKSLPHRFLSSKWYVSYSQYAEKRFPPMCSGTGYIMSTNLIRSVLIVSRNTPFFHLEDVYIALCMDKLRIKPIKLFGFSNLMVKFEPCAFQHYVVTSHGYPPHELRTVWEKINDCPQHPSVAGLAAPKNYYQEVYYDKIFS